MLEHKWSLLVEGFRFVRLAALAEQHSFFSGAPHLSPDRLERHAYVQLSPDGILGFAYDGRITELDSQGFANGLRLEDKIVTVDGKPLSEAIPCYADQEGGDTVAFVAERGGALLALTISLIRSPPQVLLFGMVPLLVALIFWGLGVGVLAFKPGDAAASFFHL